MKLVFLVCCCVALASCEIPRFTPLRFQRVKQAPYPTAGYPEGPEFTLPGEYGPASYGPPQENMPTETTTPTPEEMVTESITEIPTTEPATTEPTTENEVDGEGTEGATTENETKNDGSDAKSQRLTDGDKSEGVYYVFSPNGFLQRVVYGDGGDLAYAAQLRYQNLEEEKPVYIYNPQAFYLQPLQV